MGMFNLVEYPSTCPHCQGSLVDFQTKDGNELWMTTVPLTSLSNGASFYTICDACRGWVAYVVRWTKPPEIEVKLLPDEISRR